MKKAATLVLLFFAALTASAQTKAVDSLKRLLAVTKADTNRVNIYIQAANMSGVDSAFSYAKQALALAEKIKYKDGSARAQITLGFLFTGRGNYPK
ncbi:MAG TPA: hypothetical protein VFE54_11620, partial [Mucilaginibacter sp.]|nr:hypothetical protein [Mucilaginibacter sp.]